MRRSPLRRRTPLRHLRTMRWRPHRTRPDADPAYLARVRLLPCSARHLLGHFCAGRIEAHHAGERPGVGLKAHDYTAIPLCQLAHREWHAASGPFKTWNRDRRRAWSHEQIARTQGAMQRPCAEASP